jgi:cell division protein FtsW (lipid II flippase)
MSLTAPAWPHAHRIVRARSRSHAVRILQVFAVCVMALPSDIVLKPIGGEGYPAALVGMLAFAVWAVATVFGTHDARANRHPIRGVLCLVWVTALVSYVLMNRGLMDPHELLGADRFLMELAVISGVALVAAECLDSLQDVRRVLRALSWAAAFCGFVAALQFWMSLDLTTYLRHIPGFTLNADNSSIITRAALNRVTGIASDPIELGVAASMILPLALYVAIYDTDRKPVKRWAPVPFIVIAIAASVSRSAIIAVLLAIGIFIVLMPVRQRVVAFALLPISIAAVFMTAHGLISTLVSFFGLGTADGSIAHRVDNYTYVEQVVRHAPWFGQGGGTYIPDTTLHILDNQYLKTAIELGLVGVVVLAILFVVPMITALVARARSADPELRLLCAGLASASLAAAVCSATFDSLSFPMFANVLALVIGLSGAVWRLSARDARGCRRLSQGVAATASRPYSGHSVIDTADLKEG